MLTFAAYLEQMKTGFNPFATRVLLCFMFLREVSMLHHILPLTFLVLLMC